MRSDTYTFVSRSVTDRTYYRSSETIPCGEARASLDALVADLQEKATHAARPRFNKPLMWAYYTEVARQIAGHFDLDHYRSDEAIIGELIVYTRDCVRVASSGGVRPLEAATWWAVGVYCRRLLNSLGYSCEFASLDWLRKWAGVAE